jgi:hypothetical protein
MNKLETVYLIFNLFSKKKAHKFLLIRAHTLSQIHRPLCSFIAVSHVKNGTRTEETRRCSFLAGPFMDVARSKGASRQVAARTQETTPLLLSLPIGRRSPSSCERTCVILDHRTYRYITLHHLSICTFATRGLVVVYAYVSICDWCSTSKAQYNNDSSKQLSCFPNPLTTFPLSLSAGLLFSCAVPWPALRHGSQRRPGQRRGRPRPQLVPAAVLGAGAGAGAGAAGILLLHLL